MSIDDRIRRIQAEIADALARSGRAAGQARIVAVTKTVDRPAVDRAYEAGLRDFGENRIQDSLQKFNHPLPPDARLHLIGSLQTNKVRDALNLFSVIHSVDRLGLVDALQKRAETEEHQADVLIQVNIAGESQKHGCAIDEVDEILRSTMVADNLRPVGLMTIAPLVGDPEAARPVFQRLRDLRDQLQERYPSLTLSELSMGMTNDYIVAVEEGSTMVRIGRAIFSGP